METGKRSGAILRLFFFVGFLILWASLPLTARTPPREIEKMLPLKVGIYQYQPILYENEQNRIRGIFPELVNYIARREGWEIEYFSGTWPRGLSRLEKGKIDLMLGIGYTKARAKKFAYNNRAFIADWAQVYVPISSRIETFADLEHKRIGVLKRDIFYDEGPEGIKNLMGRFNYDCTFVEYDNYRIIFKDLLAKEIDAGVFGRMIGRRLDKVLDPRNKVKAAPITFSPYSMLAAFPRGKEVNSYLISRIDYWLEKLKEKPNSTYTEILHKYLGEEKSPSEFPEWVWYSFGGLVVLLVLLLVGTYVLRRQVNTKTAEIRTVNRSLQLINACNQMLIRASSEEQLYRDICEIIVENAGYRMAWVGILDEGQLSEAASEGTVKGYLDEITFRTDQAGENSDPVIKAIETNTIQICDDIESLAPSVNWRRSALDRNYAVSITLPLAPGDEVNGVLNIYSARPESFSREEKELLQDLAADVSFGIRVLRTRRQRQKSLEEKEILLREVHHRVKNNLFTITSLLEMQQAEAENEEICAALQSAIDRIHSMAVLHQKIYAGIDLQEVKAGEYLKELIEELVETHSKEGKAPGLNFEFDVEKVEFDDLIPLGLVVTELVANSLEHGLVGEKRGKVSVKFIEGGEQYQLCIQHTGEGLSPDFEFEQDSGLGLRLVKKIISTQLGGELILKIGEPAKFTITWPVG